MEFEVPSERVVSVRLNKEEAQALTAAARFRGMKLSTYIKSIALRDASQPQVIVNWGTTTIMPPQTTWTS